MAKVWNCEICEKPVSELGAYCKRTTTAYRHMSCHSESVLNAGIEQGRQQILDEQAEAKRREIEERRTSLRALFDKLPRCPKCGVKMSTAGAEDASQFSEYGEVRGASSSGRCTQCVREEVQARAAARTTAAPTTPAQAIQSAPTRPVEAATQEKPEEPVDRFKLIDMD